MPVILIVYKWNHIWYVLLNRCHGGVAMYQVCFEHGTSDALRDFFTSVHERAAGTPGSQVLFHLFNDTAIRDVTDEAAALLRDVVPDALYVGCSSAGNICNGAYVAGGLPNLTVVANLFELPTTKVEVHQFALDVQHREQTADALLQLVDERPWVKAVEIVTTVIDVGMYQFCEEISAIRDDIVFFGGGAFSNETADMFAGLPYVFSSDGASNGHSIVFVLYGGDDFHATTQAVSGWKPLGMPLQLTRASESVVYEIDGEPAFDRYHHYLSIENNEHFSENSLLFPFAFEHNDAMVIKAPAQVGEDGSITLTSDMAPNQRTCRIAYGDPATILRSVKESADALRAFAPQSILSFSCAARLMYWGQEYVRCETLPFNAIAPTAGFYTGGEFARHGKRLFHHNVTLVMAGMREGDAPDHPVKRGKVEQTQFNRQMAIVNSLTTFIGAASAELQDAYDQMERMAKIDGLTGVFNRREIEARIVAALHDCAEDASRTLPSIIMFDLDDFKKVNDVYGHKAGDDVLRAFGSLLYRLVQEPGNGWCGRWGGEEFMVLLPTCPLDSAERIATEIADAFAVTSFELSGRHTTSAGVAQALEGETCDLLCLRADKALYAAKKHGKNCIIVA